MNFTFMSKFPVRIAGEIFIYEPWFRTSWIQWEIKDIPQDLAVNFMHQLSSNSLSNHYHWHLVWYHLAYYYHLAFLQASDSDASAEDL
jgi:hypothetical protein